MSVRSGPPVVCLLIVLSVLVTVAVLVGICVARSPTAADLAVRFLAPLLAVCVLVVIALVCPGLLGKIRTFVRKLL